MGYGAGKGRRVNYGGYAARGGRSSNTTMEFADWVLSLEDQVDLNHSIANSSIAAGSHYTTEPGQYYDSATQQWHPYGYGPAYQATPPVTTAPYVLTPHAIPTSAPTTAPPHVITPATLTTAPAHPPAPPSAVVMNSAPAAAKARPALPDPSQTTPFATAPPATAPTATAPTATAPTTTAPTTTAATAPAPSTTPLTPAPPSYIHHQIKVKHHGELLEQLKLQQFAKS